jgi:ethanolamine utilization protein EutN
MLLARVTGCVWASAKDPHLDGKKLLVVQPIDAQLKPRGKAVIAIDAVGAGAGELVYYCKGKEASFPWLPEEVPTEATIVGIVDHVDLV